MKTFMLRKEDVNTKFYVIDAKDVTLGKVATTAAHILRGKHKVTFTPHVNCGDAVIIVNAGKLFVYEGENHNHEAQKPEKIEL